MSKDNFSKDFVKGELEYLQELGVIETSKVKIDPDTYNALVAVENAHFRTNKDTGANPNALLVWNALRRQLGLPWLSLDDLPKYDAERKGYFAPDDSKLLVNLKKNEN